MFDKQAQMRRLVDDLNHYSEAYYTRDEPLISDAEWDGLYARLQAMEQETGFSFPDSPTHRVGGQVLEGFEEHTHLSRLWSLDKAQTREELTAWFDRTDRLIREDGSLPEPTYGIEYKFDGLTLVLTYRDGVLVEAATRGNGTTGEAVLPQARTIRSVPLTIPYKGLIEVHGECVMLLSELEKYNLSAAVPLKNARNAAAGGLRNLDPKVTAARHLSAFFYMVNTITDAPYSDQDGMIAFLREQGFPVSPYFKNCAGREEVLAALDEIEARRPSLDFLIDGAVIKLRDQRTRDALGYTDKFPRWAVAYKFAAEEMTSVLRSVTWELGRTGKVTPLAHVDPVDFTGVTVEKATLNNYGDILRKDLALGCRVFIRRSNDVIPEILGRAGGPQPGEEPIVRPEKCPACGQPLTQRGANLFCLNRETCRPQAVSRVAYYASRAGMDIESLSVKTAGQLYDAGLVRHISDLYSLDREKLMTLDGFKDKRSDNLLAALEKTKDCSLAAFLVAVGIPGIGRSTASALAARYHTLDRIRALTQEELLQMEDIGPNTAQAIVEFFGFEENKRMIGELLGAGVRPREEKAAENGAPLAGKIFVLTGTLSGMTRSEAEGRIRALGGTASSSVSKKTTFVVAGENAGSKLDKANALKVPVLTEQAFIDMLEGL